MRVLWQMAVGRREEWRMLLLSQAWAIGRLFDKSASRVDVEQFIRTGSHGASGGDREPPNHLVDEKVAEILANGGKLIVRL